MIDKKQLAELLRRYQKAQESRKDEPRGDFEKFRATQLFCPKCKDAVPVREKLLLVLPDGDLYEYLCVQCGSSVGEKKDKGAKNVQVIV